METKHIIDHFSTTAHSHSGETSLTQTDDWTGYRDKKEYLYYVSRFPVSSPIEISTLDTHWGNKYQECIQTLIKYNGMPLVNKQTKSNVIKCDPLQQLHFSMVNPIDLQLKSPPLSALHIS